MQAFKKEVPDMDPGELRFALSNQKQLNLYLEECKKNAKTPFPSKPYPTSPSRRGFYMLSSKNRVASAERRATSSSGAFGIFSEGLPAFWRRNPLASRVSRDFMAELNSETAEESRSDCFFRSETPSAAKTDFSNDSTASLTDWESDSRASGSDSFETPRLSKFATSAFTAHRTYEKNPGALRS